MFDLFDVEMSEDGSAVTLPAAIGGDATVDSVVGMTILDLAGVYDPRGDGQGFSLIYGTRILSERAALDATIETEPPSTLSHDVDETIVDALVGVRYTKQLSRRFTTQLRADVSTGGTDLTWSAASEIRFALGKSGRYALTGGYKYMLVDFSSADSTDVDMTLSGFHTGLRISF
jgi:hypothetical protein